MSSLKVRPTVPEDVPPINLQWRTESRVERLNEQAYGAAWAWLPLPLWLTLVDPFDDNNGAELSRLARLWAARRPAAPNNSAHAAARQRRSLPVLAR